MSKAFLALVLVASLASQPNLRGSLWTLVSAAWSESSLDAGCGWDPNGKCAPAQPQTDEGCGWDPSGKPRCSA